jgi:outer membrane immunogenic protein
MKTILGVLAVSALLAAPVTAADLPARMPVKATPVVAAPMFTWTGCYIGAHGGYGFGQKRWTEVGPLGSNEFTQHDVDGWLVGGQVGCNMQQGQWVFGVEGEASWADINGSSTLTQGGFNATYNSKADIVGTIALRLGYAVDRTLFYAKGGAAFAHDHHWGQTNLGGGTSLETDKYLRWGWTVGGGIEYAFTNNWSGKIEYNYMDLGRKEVPLCTVGVPGDCINVSFKQHINVVKVGINYRFGQAPVVARY